MKKRIIAIFAAISLMPASALAYDTNYLDTTGRSVGEAADKRGMVYSDFVSFFALPDDMPEWEIENVALNNIPLERFCELLDTDYDEYVKGLGIDADVTKETTVGKADDLTPLGKLWGEDFDALSDMYSLTDVTKDTLFGEVREIIEKKESADALLGKFTDVPYSHWAKYYIDTIKSYGIIDGYNDFTYRPENTVSRAEFSKLLTMSFYLDTEKEPIAVYADVDQSLWYAPYTNAVSELLPGKDGKFMPDAAAERGDVAAAIVKALGYEPDADKEYLKSLFTDTDTIAEENLGYVTTAVKLGIIDGYDDNKIGGKDSLTRAQTAAIFYRALLTPLTVNEKYSETAITFGETQLTLGDLVVAYHISGASLEKDEDVTAIMLIVADDVLTSLKASEAAKSLDKKLSEEDAINARVMRETLAAKNNGLKHFNQVLKAYGSGLEFVDSLYTGYVTRDTLLTDFTEADIDELTKNIKAEINNEAIATLTLADL